MLFGTITKLPALVRILVARQVISLTRPSMLGDAHPVADAERLLDLNRQPGKEVAERVLQREADDHRADRRRREDPVLQE